MSKFYAQWRRPKPKERPWKVHPIWRGIGCFMAILIPILSFGIADLIVRANLNERWVIIPRDLAGPSGNPYLFAKILLAVVVAVAIFGTFTVVYILIYSISGPSAYGPLDAPPTRRRRLLRRRRR